MSDPRGRPTPGLGPGGVRLEVDGGLALAGRRGTVLTRTRYVD